MNQIKAVFLYVLALTVLLAPVIILGWIGLSLLSWPGLIIGIFLGGLIFYSSMKKVIEQGADADEEELAEEITQTPETAVASVEK